MKVTQALTGHSDRVWAVAYCPKLDLIASVSGDKTLRLWGRSPEGTWVLQQLIEGVHDKTIRAVAFNEEGSLLAAGSFDKTVSVYRLAEGKYELGCKLQGHEFEVKSLAWEHTGPRLATCSRDKNIWVWVPESGDYICDSVLSGHSQDVKHVRWLWKEQSMVSCSYDNTLRFWTQEGDDFKCLQTLECHSSTVWACEVDSEDRQLIAASDDSTISVWARQPDGLFSLQRKLEGLHSSQVYSIALFRDLLLSCGADMQLIALERGAWKERARSEEAHEGEVNCVVAAGDEVVTCGDDRKVRVWQLD